MSVDKENLKALAEAADMKRATFGAGIHHREAFRSATRPDAILKLLAEIEDLRKDAERYRWLRDPDNQCSVEDDSDYYMPPMICGYAEHEDILTHEALDKAIDSAMTKEK